MNAGVTCHEDKGTGRHGRGRHMRPKRKAHAKKEVKDWLKVDRNQERVVKSGS